MTCSVGFRGAGLAGPSESSRALSRRRTAGPPKTRGAAGVGWETRRKRCRSLRKQSSSDSRLGCLELITFYPATTSEGPKFGQELAVAGLVGGGGILPWQGWRRTDGCHSIQVIQWQSASDWSGGNSASSRTRCSSPRSDGCWPIRPPAGPLSVADAGLIREVQVSYNDVHVLFLANLGLGERKA